VAEQLVRFHNEGEFGKLPRSEELLRAIAVPAIADDMAVWVMRHSEKLKDADTCAVFLRDPVSYGLSLRKLADGVRDYRNAQAAWKQTATMPTKADSGAALPEAQTEAGPPGELKVVGLMVGGIAIGMLVVRRLRRGSNW
jgi:hypothetical protein